MNYYRVMMDRVLDNIAAALKDGLPWLDNAYGRAERIKRVQAGRIYYTPAAYVGAGRRENDYLGLLPDSGLGNFSFFAIDDPQTISPGPGIRDIRTSFSLVFWFDLRSIYGDGITRDIESLKMQVIDLLGGNTSWRPDADTRIIISRIYDRAENIYRGFSLDEVDNQYLIHPYGGFRIEGTLEYSEDCVPLPPVETWFLRTAGGVLFLCADGERIIVNHQ